ncbi:MAG: hypothetical protein M9949_04935 [Candidatus Kapabacteria bacterium]|nr:hypothetical protein [Candidatus Kapabacteria bacterium]
MYKMKAKYRYLVASEYAISYFTNHLPKFSSCVEIVYDLQECKFTYNGKVWFDIEVAEGESVK